MALSYFPSLLRLGATLSLHPQNLNDFSHSDPVRYTYDLLSCVTSNTSLSSDEKDHIQTIYPYLRLANPTYDWTGIPTLDVLRFFGLVRSP